MQTISSWTDVNGGCLRVGDSEVLARIPANVMVNHVAERSASLLSPDWSKGSPGGRKVFPFGKLRYSRFWCLFRDNDGWTIPHWGEPSNQVPPETQLLLLELRKPPPLNQHGDDDANFYVLLLPVQDSHYRASLQGTSEGELLISVETGNPAAQTSQAHGVLLVSSGDNPFELIGSSTKLLAQLKGTFRCVDKKEKKTTLKKLSAQILYYWKRVSLTEKQERTDEIQFSPFGSLDMHDSGGTFKFRHMIRPAECIITAEGLNDNHFSVYSSKAPQHCTVDRCSTEFNYNSKYNLLTITIPRTDSANPSQRVINITYHGTLRAPYHGVHNYGSVTDDHRVIDIEDMEKPKQENLPGHVVNIEREGMEKRKEVCEDRNREWSLQLLVVLLIGGYATMSVKDANPPYHDVIYIAEILNALTVSSLVICCILIVCAVRITKDGEAPRVSPWVWRLISFMGACSMVSYCLNFFHKLHGQAGK